MEKAKAWETPKMVELDIEATAWDTTNGETADLYFENCVPLYELPS